MMKEYEYLFVTTLHSKLKRKIVGRIYCTVIQQDKLYVKIVNNDDMKFEMYLDDFGDKFYHGLTTDYVMYDIMKKYRKFIENRINQRYFYEEKEEEII